MDSTISGKNGLVSNHNQGGVGAFWNPRGGEDLPKDVGVPDREGGKRPHHVGAGPDPGPPPGILPLHRSRSILLDL